jgi:alkylated DNA repair dioxygenase AlkB
MENLNLPNSEILFDKDFLSKSEANFYLESIFESTPWRQDKITIYGKTFDVPRLQQWYGDEGLSYTWSGIKMNPLPWTNDLLVIKEKVESVANCAFNTVLLNLYRDGNDTVGWHSDNEKELGENPVIASISLGSSRDFQMRHVSDKSIEGLTVSLDHGSLLVMAGETQKYWQHQIPRRKKVKEKRINLTFRKIIQG